jgi:AcrR family transcriptional regulator
MGIKRSGGTTEAPTPGGHCTVCSHPKATELNRQLLLKQRTAADIARELGLHRSAVTRHFHRHLLPPAQDEARTMIADLNVREETRGLYAKAKDLLNRADNADNWPACKAFLSEARGSLELLAHLNGDLPREHAQPAGAQVAVVVLPVAGLPGPAAPVARVLPAGAVRFLPASDTDGACDG